MRVSLNNIQSINQYTIMNNNHLDLWTRVSLNNIQSINQYTIFGLVGNLKLLIFSVTLTSAKPWKIKKKKHR